MKIQFTSDVPKMTRSHSKTYSTQCTSQDESDVINIMYLTAPHSQDLEPLRLSLVATTSQQ